MSYRNIVPSGTQFNGQQPVGHHQTAGRQAMGQQPMNQQPTPQAVYPQYDSNGYSNGSAQQYENVQFVQPSALYLNNPSQFANGYNAPEFDRPPPPPITAPPPVHPQFVNSSFPQQQTVPAVPANQHAAPPAAAPAPITMGSQISHLSRQPQHTSSAESSPRLDHRLAPAQSPRVKSAVTKDPRRSSTGTNASAKSPMLSHTPHFDALPLLLRVAEDCFSQADAAARGVAKSMAASEIKDHHKLIATGLGCLEVALRSTKLQPRLEARLCLRYASILIEETTNLMEAETTLTRGIAVCEKNRFADLKYSSQFLLMKTLFQRNQKAAFKSIDTHIADCSTFKHIHWVYAFRFLKASFHVQSGTAADNHALENLRGIAAIAKQRGDNAIHVMASLLEGLAHLGAMKGDWVARVQTCLAQAATLQLDPSVHLPQLDILLLQLDVACSLPDKQQSTAIKLANLQRRMEEWERSANSASPWNEVHLPVKRVGNASQTISNDTRAVLRPGDGEADYLVFPALTVQECRAITSIFEGLVNPFQEHTGRSTKPWDHAVEILRDINSVPPSHSLTDAVKQASWARYLVCFANILAGLHAATCSDWATVKRMAELVQGYQDLPERLALLALYLTGVFYQGTEKLDDALRIWKGRKFDIEYPGRMTNATHMEKALALLATFNRLWIMMEPSRLDVAEQRRLVGLLAPFCADHASGMGMEIVRAYNLVTVSIESDPPLTWNQVKAGLQVCLNHWCHPHCISIGLNFMRWVFFENVVGEQAMKSAKAAVRQAERSGNLLWQSVAAGQLAQTFEFHGANSEAQENWQAGVMLANKGMERTHV
ncbi:MAU2 chromatid cohesion factor [Diplogelasinospora grovesii]|uniref:MAU2 chromatid cohesion factor n=1 Tax=Diplogelasinospora grovesii TaxID=303347 RepID=A0AAN6NJQ2_9PEZI|nr:MAU2 chromatid cohesion factor [Diplogelasinospora grovesii]